MTKNDFIYALKTSGCLYRNGQTYYEENELIRTFEDMEMFEEEKSLKDMTKLEHAIRHIKTKADAWAVKEVEKALSQEPCEKCEVGNPCLYCKHEFSQSDTSIEQEPCDKPMRDFTEEEAKAYSKALDKMYKPTGFNVFDEQCTDAVSREAVLGAICDYIAFEEYEDKSHTFTIRPLTKRIKQLPSVTQKSGKWIDQSDEGYVECPFCGHATTCEDNIDELHYCFYCGARMESEE